MFNSVLVIDYIKILSDFKGDLFSENDLYLVVEYNNEVRKTSTKWDVKGPGEWNELISFRTTSSACKCHSNITITIYDEDTWSKNNQLFTKTIRLDPQKNTAISSGIHIEYGFFNLVKKDELDSMENELFQLNDRLKTINALSTI